MVSKEIKNQRRGVEARWVSTWRQIIAIRLSRGPVVADVLVAISDLVFKSLKLHKAKGLLQVNSLCHP